MNTDYNDINIFMSLKNPCTFFAHERRLQNEFVTQTP